MAQKKTFLYSETVIVTTSEGYLTLPALRKFTVINVGSVDCEINLDNAIADANRKPFTAYQNVPYSFGAGHVVLHHKTGTGTTTLQIVGERMIKE